MCVVVLGLCEQLGHHALDLVGGIAVIAGIVRLGEDGVGKFTLSSPGV